jgi:methylated-DNA-[protein]-cysteine S-methyltransferase
MTNDPATGEQEPEHADGGGFALFDSAIGHCGIAWGRAALVGVLLPEGTEAATRRRMQRLHPRLREIMIAAAPAFARRAIDRIVAMLAGEPDDLADLPLDMSAVPEFHRRVYMLVRGIGPGDTLTYGEVATRLGDPAAARAVGQALGRNPYAPVIPCHRVLAAGGRSGGFSAGGGVGTKLRMLQAEGARMSADPGLFDGDPAAYR